MRQWCIIIPGELPHPLSGRLSVMVMMCWPPTPVMPLDGGLLQVKELLVPLSWGKYSLLHWIYSELQQQFSNLIGPRKADQGWRKDRILVVLLQLILISFMASTLPLPFPGFYTIPPGPYQGQGFYSSNSDCTTLIKLMVRNDNKAMFFHCCCVT